MPGTGKKGYTGASLYGGNYNIQNGIIQSGSGANSSAVASRNSAYGQGINAITNSPINQGAVNLASSIGRIASVDDSDYGDYIRELRDISANNTAQSQAFAREQMQFQRDSDANAMAWSAAEAQKNRDWQERLSNTAHQREVQDLIVAGLNPILSANQGAYTGSGATGQGFSSAGAMGQVDNSVGAAMASLYNTVMNTASQAAIAGMYVDAEKYQADMSYASAKTSAEASIYNNNNNIEANKAINAMNNDAALQRANISSAATLGAAGMNAAAIRASSENAAAASMYGSDKSLEASNYRADLEFSQKTEHSFTQDPVGYVYNVGKNLLGSGNRPSASSYNYDWSLNNGGS